MNDKLKPKGWDGHDDKAHKENGIWMFLPWGYHTKHSSVEMPRYLSRITFDVTSVEVEKVKNTWKWVIGIKVSPKGVVEEVA